MFSFNSVAVLAFLLHSLLLCLPVYSIPLDVRQADNPPQPATGFSSVTTAVFPTATCVSTFTSKIDSQGENIIEEVEECEVEVRFLSSEGSSNRITSTTSSSTTSSTTTTTVTVTSPPTTSTSPPASSNSPPASSTSPPATSTSSIDTSTSSPDTSTSSPDISTSSPIGASPPISTTPPSPSPSTTAIGGGLPGGVDITTSTLTSSISTQPSAAGVSAAAAESSMPGKKLSVLPIGLGVFAGISVIALIVVGLVTYERTKYRKAFRQRKLAEAGAPMAYGGTEY